MNKSQTYYTVIKLYYSKVPLLEKILSGDILILVEERKHHESS